MAYAARITNNRDGDSGITRVHAFITAAEVVALGASTTGEIQICTIPAGAQIIKAHVRNGGTVVATLATLTASLGINGATTGIMAAETVHAANANAESGLSAAQSIYAETTARLVVVEFTGDVNLSTMTGAAPGGFYVELAYLERLIPA